jgi:predicted RND superfamily exporter protein
MALAGAFLTTSGGFGILFFHQLPPLQQFGVMIALSIAYSFLASAYVLPTFLILWAKWRNNFRAKRGKEEEIVQDEEEQGEDKGDILEDANQGVKKEDNLEDEEKAAKKKDSLGENESEEVDLKVKEKEG